MDSYRKPISDVVKDEKWQALRESLIGTWKHSPAANIKRLREYLLDPRVTEAEYRLRLRRVRNYLTGSGFRLRIIRHSSIDRLLGEVRKRANR